MSSRILLGVYPHFDEFLASVKKLRQEGFKDILLFSPAPRHELEEVLESKPSPVRWVTLFGALLGCLAGYVMTVWMSQDWPLVTGGKPIGSWDGHGVQAYVVIIFETTILLGAISNLLAMVIFSRLPQIRVGAYDARFSNDHFGVQVRTNDASLSKVEEIMKSSGAKEVSRV